MHDHDHDHDHAHSHEEPPSLVDLPHDQAAESLADALRWSFRLLTGIMVLVLVAFLWTGVTTIETSQQGVMKVFGKVIGTAKPGLVYTWPFPIGEVKKVPMKEQSLKVMDFWMFETPEDQTKALIDRAAPRAMRAGLDWALLTGDRNLLHVKLECHYAIKDPVAYEREAGDPNVLQDMIRSAICKAGIHDGASRAGDAIRGNDQLAFKDNIRQEAQAELNRLLGCPANNPAVQITDVLMPEATWPLTALPSYSAAQQASSKKEMRINTARAEAEKTLNAACVNYRQLVGEAGLDDPNGLINQYERALERKDDKPGADLLAQIDAVLMSSAGGGEVSRIIDEARAYQNAVTQEVASRAQKFRMLLGEYQKSPRFMLERLWAEARDEILSSPTVEKQYITPGSGKTVIRISRDPKVAKDIQEEELKAAKDASPK